VCSTGNCQAKLADLGESCFSSNCNGLHGTPYYTAPEMFRWEFNARRNDVWSMGVILYEILNNGKLPSKFLGTNLPGLEQAVKAFDITTQSEYQIMTKSPFKTLLAEMMNTDVNTRITSDVALDTALRALKGCGIIAEKGQRCEADASKVHRLLPTCWQGPPGDWRPGFSIKEPEPVIQQVQEVKQQLPTVQKPKPVKKIVYELVERPVMKKRPLPQMIKERESGKDGLQKHEIRFTQGNLGAKVSDENGLVEEVTLDGAFDEGNVQEGWFIDKICGKPFSLELFKAAQIGDCPEYPYTIVFLQPTLPDVPLPEINEGIQMVSKQEEVGTGTLLSFHIPNPKTNIAVGYIFKNNLSQNRFGQQIMYVSEHGVVQHPWKKLKKAYLRGVPLKPGDEIISVNDEKWDDLQKDEILKAELLSGKNGGLTFLYLKA